MTPLKASLDYDFTGLFRGVSRKNFPSIANIGTGIRINVDGLDYNNGMLSFNVLVAYCFSRSFIMKFHNVEWSLILTIDDIASARGLSLNLRDPHKRYQNSRRAERTFPRTEEPVSFVESYVEIPLAIRVLKPIFSPSIFLTVTLHEFQSNRIGLDLLKMEVNPYADGKRANLELMDEGGIDED